MSNPCAGKWVLANGRIVDDLCVRRLAASSVKLLKLINADSYRDGGSYEALFATDEGTDYCLWLERSRMPNDEGRHHRWLFEYRGCERPLDCIPFVTGSIEEQQIVQRIRDFLDQPASDLSFAPWLPLDNRIKNLGDMLDYILRREPCFPADLRAAGFVTT